MRKEYDFSTSKKNPYAKVLKEQITIRIEKDVISYFKKLSEKTGIPYQNLMNYYLRECALSKLQPEINWKKTGT